MADIAFFLHTLRSDWNNGNAHFLRGLAREMGSLGHTVTVYEPAAGWSYQNLLTEPNGQASLDQFAATYPDVALRLYDPTDPELGDELRRALHAADVVIVHEWNEPALIGSILSLREELGFKALFHDTHHRASSSPESVRAQRVNEFDGVLTFGDALTAIYKQRFGLDAVWTLHEAADTTVFYPREAPVENELVWVGNWGDGERVGRAAGVSDRAGGALADVGRDGVSLDDLWCALPGGWSGCAARGGHPVWRVPAESCRAGRVCAEPDDDACAAAAVQRRAEGDSDDPCV